MKNIVVTLVVSLNLITSTLAMQAKTLAEIQCEQDHLLAQALQAIEYENVGIEWSPSSVHIDNTQFPIPSPLNRYAITHLKAIQQSGVSCGSWTLTNAWALTELIKDGITPRDITSKAVECKAQEKAHLINNNEELTLDRVHQLNQERYKIPVYIIAYSPRKNAVINVDFGIKDAFKTFKQKDNDMLFFACNTSDNFETGGHWICIAAVKMNGKAHVFLMDSCNGRIKPGNSFYHLAEYVCKNTQ